MVGPSLSQRLYPDEHYRVHDPDYYTTTSTEEDREEDEGFNDPTNAILVAETASDRVILQLACTNSDSSCGYYENLRRVRDERVVNNEWTRTFWRCPRKDFDGCLQGSESKTVLYPRRSRPRWHRGRWKAKT